MPSSTMLTIASICSGVIEASLRVKRGPSQSGGEQQGDPNGTGNWGVQDFPFWKALHDGGGKFVGAPDITWLWHHHGQNTSGVPTRW